MDTLTFQIKQEEAYRKNDRTETPEQSPSPSEMPDLMIDPVQVRKTFQLANHNGVELVLWKKESKA